MRQKENRPGAGDAYGTVPYNCINDITDICESQSIAYDDLLEAVTLAYLSDIDTDLSPDFSTVKVELLEITNDCIEKYNLGRPDENVPTTAKKSERYPDAKKPEARYRRLTALHPLQIAILIRELHHGVGILWNKAENEGNFDIGIYQTDGDNEGCYDTRDETLERLIRSYDKTMSLRGVGETVAILRSICKRVERCSDRDLIPVNNGIFDYGSKVLLGFDPEYVFTSKSKVDFVPNARNPVIHNDDDGTDWDVHLEHQLAKRPLDVCNMSIYEIKRRTAEKISELMASVSDSDARGLLLIGGDVADSIALEKLFYEQLSSWDGWRGRIISVLGNHELWDGDPRWTRSASTS